MKPSRADLSILSRFPKFEDTYPGLSYAPSMPGRMVREAQEALALARRFNDEIARPLGVKLDRTTREDPAYLPLELMEEANRRGFYTMWTPRIFGGKGCSLPSLSYFMEEVASACLGIANVIGVHYLGVAGLTAAANPGLANRILREVADGERTGRPCLVSLAVTEPLAGTDVEEVELLDRGRVGCQAKPVRGGYVVNGAKAFISMGHVSTWTVRQRPEQAVKAFI